MLRLSAPESVLCSAFLDSRSFVTLEKNELMKDFLISSKVEKKIAGCRNPPSAGRELSSSVYTDWHVIVRADIFAD